MSHPRHFLFQHPAISLQKWYKHWCAIYLSYFLKNIFILRSLIHTGPVFFVVKWMMTYLIAWDCDRHTILLTNLLDINPQIFDEIFLLNSGMHWWRTRMSNASCDFIISIIAFIYTSVYLFRPIRNQDYKELNCV